MKFDLMDLKGLVLAYLGVILMTIFFINQNISFLISFLFIGWIYFMYLGVKVI